MSERSRRQARRSSGLACLTLAAAAALLAAGCAPSAGSKAPPGAGGVVPWVDRPAPPYLGPAQARPAADARPCRPADLSVRRGRAGVGLGHTNLEILFVNRSASPCLLAGYPTVAGIAAGTAVGLHGWHGSYFGDPGPAANIATGQAAAVNVSGADACQAAQAGQHRVFLALRIGLPAGGSVVARAAMFDAVCGVSVSRFGVPAYLPKAPPPSPLIARIAAAATVRPGEDFGYTVTLTNPTATAYPLRPCPSYQEYVVAVPRGAATSGPDGYVAKYYYLNCDVTRRIAAHGSVAFQMRLKLPAGLPVGVPAKFVWQLQGGAGPAASSPLRTSR